MRAIGIRVEPDKVTYAIVDGTENELTLYSTDTIKLPRALDFPNQLRHVRTTVLTILQENDILAAAIRTTEPKAMKKSIPRVMIEGMLTEAIASAGVKVFCSGPIASLESRLKVKKGSFKKVRSAADIEFDEGWAERTELERESILAALAVLPNPPQL